MGRGRDNACLPCEAHAREFFELLHCEAVGTVVVVVGGGRGGVVVAAFLIVSGGGS